MLMFSFQKKPFKFLKIEFEALRHLYQTQHTSASVRKTKRPAMPRIITVLHCPPGRTSKPKKMDLKTGSKCSSDLGAEAKTTATSLLHWKAK